MKTMLRKKRFITTSGSLRFIVLLFAVVLCAQLGACSTMPLKSAVVNIASSRLQELMALPAVENYTYAFPSRWDETRYKGFLSIKMMADVEVPNVTRFPILKVSPTPFTIDQVKAICQSLAPNRRLFQWHESDKSQVESVLLRTRQLIQEDRRAEDHPFGYAFDKCIDDLNALLTKAPVANIEIPVPMEFVRMKSGDFFSAMTAPDKSGRRLRVMCSNRNAVVGNSIRADYQEPLESFIECRQPWREEIPMPLAVKDAQSTAESWMLQVGIKDFTLQHIGVGVKVDAALISVYPKLPYQPNVYEKLENCYVFVYSPQYNGIACNYSINRTAIEDPASSDLWKDEFLKILVSKDGIESISWQNGRGKTEQVLNENVLLLAFPKIQNIIMAHFLNVYSNTDDNVRTSFEIERITLSYRKVLITRQKDAYVLIPAWDIYGRLFLKMPEGTVMRDFPQDADGRFVDNQYMQSLLTINALDGSIMETSDEYSEAGNAVNAFE